MNTPLLSVIVCTYNRERLLDNCLASLCKQEVDKELYEVIVVDNNSKADTFGVFSKHAGKNGNFRYLTEENQGLSYARNKGCNEARGQYLAYIDDDALPPPEYLRNVLGVIRRHEPDILGGPVYPYYMEEKPYWFDDEYETRKYAESSGFSRTCGVSGSNFIIKKSILEQIGKFDVKIGMRGGELGLGEDAKVLHTYRSKTGEKTEKVYYALECYVKHLVPKHKMKVRYIMKRAYYGGRIYVRSGMAGEEIRVGRLVRMTFGNFYGIMRRLLSGVKVHGPRRVDFVVACRTFFSSMGIFMEGLNQVIVSRKHLNSGSR